MKGHPMKMRFRFEKLEIWHDARRMNQIVYRLTRQFPREEQFAMISQIRRASTSVTSNIAEGSGRNSDKDFAHYLEQAYASLMELASTFYLALDEGYVKESDLGPLLDELEKLARRTAALNRSLSVPVSKTPFTRTKPPALGPRRSPLD
jgi:four helix bundle protein